MDFKLKIFAAAVAIALPGAASAASIFATSVTANTNGSVETCSVQASDSSRTNICNTLGEDDGDYANGSGQGFFSLKNADQLNFSFGTPFTGPVHVYEITGNPERQPEFADLTIFATNGNGQSVAGTIANTEGELVSGTSSRYEIVFDDISGGPFTQITVQDDSTSPDGFDIDAIAVSAVPLPAPALMLLAGLGGLAATRRKKA